MSPAAISNATPTAAPISSKTSLKSSIQSGIAPSPNSSSKTHDDIPAWVNPDLTRLMRVDKRPGNYASASYSLVALPAGAVFARITQPTVATVAYSSVQAGKNLHIELNCDLVYINHSCSPTLIFDMANWVVRVNPDLEGGLKEGDELTFFYPSTEWSMAQPFDCLCKTSECRKTIKGAKDMSLGDLDEYWLSEHIKELLHERDAKKRGL
ncbi:uncharacterized protein M421DRAFT_7511 [Didymella exigua CBS 183.55]|uniref:Post-SET domain-containing protein n=1 Tax=Didymella exigua CBS 183.55 TaxID=1150837 RepID=A0A6A5REB6_9PLEO|nr:uncharacterized protein M421DRAFT_7511 [Didymella exigua CBS 183.55]KAF1926012.1 hypothetical protein M421DRAFT_7511 [Didymella exigua CBS 183.55]